MSDREQQLVEELKRSWDQTIQTIKDQHGGQVPISYVLNNQPLPKKRG